MDVGYEYTTGTTLLKVENLHVAYPDKEGKPVSILRGVDFSIEDIIRPNLNQGQVDALLAPSGMGKTQLFRCIAGLKTPTSGKVLVEDGQGCNPVSLGKVGVVAQDYPLFEHMSVLDNLMTVSCRRQDRTAAKAECLALLEKFGLSDKADLYPAQLSGGQRQRVAILQTKACNSHLLLMDEPFSGLDIIMKEEVEHLIAGIAAADTLNSVIITTHDIQSAIACADTILMLGRERDASGAVVQGAFIKFRYDLIERGLAWHPNIAGTPAFAELEREIKARFKEL